jgi:2-polyprenyl-3-methyl-5-hydroxy-6-metoxy-1,4-benzoquinol methylase
VVYDLWLCLGCGAVLNVTHLREAQADGAFLDWQAESSDVFYSVTPEYLASVPAQVEADTFIDFLIGCCPECPRGTLLDFGAGRGITAAAAAKHFDRVYASDLSLKVLSKVHEVMPRREKVIVTNDHRTIPDRLDAVVALHVLEHLPFMRDTADDLIGRLNPGGVLLFQVPMLRNDYLVCVHYTFFNEACCRSFAHEAGLEVLGVWFDHELDFLTCIARKPS